jgi:hypothetical protein
MSKKYLVNRISNINNKISLERKSKYEQYSYNYSDYRFLY